MGLRKLLFSVTIHDCRVDTFRAGGKGGQNQNKRDTGVRVVHEPSGAVGESREERSQLQNKKTAFARMALSPKFQLWVKMQSGAISSITEQMNPQNLKVEVVRNNEWVVEGKSKLEQEIEKVNDPMAKIIRQSQNLEKWVAAEFGDHMLLPDGFESDEELEEYGEEWGN